MVGRNRRASLNFIKERVWGKIQGWKEKLLSQAGKEVLLKSIVQAIPTFAMNCFWLPVGLCKDIEAITRKFWWGQRGDRRKIHWKSWDVLCKPKDEGGMGFKDLCRFNEAMLARQVWRLIHHTDSLFFKVFKANYFPNSSIFEAKPNSGSYAWRSILKARKVISQGARWHVGDGRTIRVFADKWLPGNNGSRILSPNNSLPSTSMVSGLIDHDSRDWNYHLIDASFAPVEASLIKAIPLSALPQKDLLYWPLERFGDYTVKSGYKMLCEESRREEAASSNREASKALWRGIWKMSTPGKVKHFVWKACSNALPVKLNLVKRKFLEEDVCQVCNKESETISHALWECEVLQEVWSTKFGWVDRGQARHGSFCDLVAWIQGKHQLIDLFATTAWFIWCRRNKVCLNEPAIPLNKIADEALHYLRTYRNGHSKEKRKTPRGKIKWSPPPSGMFKTNFDGAIFEELGEAGIGVVIRNFAGEVMASLSEKIPLPATVEAVEMLAARRAVKFVQEVGLAESIFEGDSQSVILALQRNTMVNSGIGHLVKDVLSSVNSLWRWSFSHTYRQGNAMAHALARRARLCESYEVWMEDVPPDITVVLLANFPVR